MLKQFSRSSVAPERALPRIQLTRRCWYSSKCLEDTRWGRRPSTAERTSLNLWHHKAATPQLQPHGLTQRPAPVRSHHSHRDQHQVLLLPQKQQEPAKNKTVMWDVVREQVTAHAGWQILKHMYLSDHGSLCLHAGELHRAAYSSAVSFTLQVVQVENEVFLIQQPWPSRQHHTTFTLNFSFGPASKYPRLLCLSNEGCCLQTEVDDL